ncbi:GNAT family N-acetyltransferase [Myxosarcina sp. GI1]|uniref:GNAT family N-acetyltransferase n=1 Tax=Myxosarcina sp. GI1 TaxID=1541065 RepID=UPI000690E527|nr:GNAT family N-acetyltransferase [Myxosarcina sp. GI1]
MKSTNNADTNFQLVIRSAQLADTREIGGILASSFYELPQFVDWIYPLLRFTIGEDLRYRMRLAAPYYCCLVALAHSGDSQSIVGTVEISLRSTSFWTDSDRFPYISNLAVKKNYRRQGVASKLLARCEQIARNWGYREIFLHVIESNYSAKQLYCQNEYQILQIKPIWGQLLPYNPSRLLLKKTIQSR